MGAALDFLNFALTTTLVLGLYFAPTLIAHKRVPLQAFRIFNWNLFTGWTGIGWLISLYMALTARPHSDHPEL
ncbi:superinfection immunity protein [Magnetovibrio sp. PR-2]|uniref:superinfection immunity protein n=1 Tax=Magnetovibrio sp. PR-2 TaxID=3120356 RepID=UPI002FCDF7FF